MLASDDSWAQIQYNQRSYKLNTQVQVLVLSHILGVFECSSSEIKVVVMRVLRALLYSPPCSESATVQAKGLTTKY